MGRMVSSLLFTRKVVARRTCPKGGLRSPRLLPRSLWSAAAAWEEANWRACPAGDLRQPHTLTGPVGLGGLCSGSMQPPARRTAMDSPHGLPGVSRSPGDFALSYPWVNAVLLHCPNIFLGPARACALLARNYDPWQHRSPLHELRFVLGALLGTNWRRELLTRVLLAWLSRCPGKRDCTNGWGHGLSGGSDSRAGT